MRMDRGGVALVVGFLLIGVAGSMVLGTSLAAGTGTQARSLGTLEPTFHGTTTTTSINWAGYAVSQAGVTDVKGSWVEPSINGSCPSVNHYASFWIGIDGYSSSTVEQTGTDSDCQGGHAVYYAWYEFYPAGSHVISSLTIKPGDHISAEVKRSGTSFTTILKDVTGGHSYAKTATVASAKGNSAEWIAEAPSNGISILPLAHFKTVVFTGATATIGGATHAIGGFSNVKITMWNNAHTKVKASPGALNSAGNSFSVKWVSAGP